MKGQIEDNSESGNHFILYSHHSHPRISESLLEKARAKMVPGTMQNIHPNPDEDEEFQAAPPKPESHTSILEHLEKTLGDIAALKSWLLQNMSLCLSDPSKASQEIRNLAELKTKQNPDFAAVAEELGLTISETDVDMGSLGHRLEKIESERLEIKKDLDLAGPARKRRGRPFGSTKKAAAHGDGEGPLLTPEKKARSGKSKGKRKAKTSVEKTDETGEGGETEAGTGPDPSATDPFADLEEKTPNKSCTISLHSKCLVVEFALKLRESGTTHSIEKEVMARFPKYFWSVEKERWKTGLLSKWLKSLVLGMAVPIL